MLILLALFSYFIPGQIWGIWVFVRIIYIVYFFSLFTHCFINRTYCRCGWQGLVFAAFCFVFVCFSSCLRKAFFFFGSLVQMNLKKLGKKEISVVETFSGNNEQTSSLSRGQRKNSKNRNLSESMKNDRNRVNLKFGVIISL